MALTVVNNVRVHCCRPGLDGDSWPGATDWRVFRPGLVVGALVGCGYLQTVLFWCWGRCLRGASLTQIGLDNRNQRRKCGRHFRLVDTSVTENKSWLG